MSDDELLDVLDADGRPTGITKPRGAVHRDGDWHRCVHVWVVSGEDVLLQRRGRAKAAWPGRLDATAAGHLTAGETVEDGLREVEEELGIAYSLDELREAGVHRVDEHQDGGVVNREFQHLFLVRDDRPLDEWTDWDRTELDGLVAVSTADFARLVAGETVPGRETGRGEVAVRADELVPAVYLQALSGLLLDLRAP